MTSWLKRTLVTVSLAVSLPVAAANYTIGTGSQSGTYYPFGGMLAKVWSENIKDFNMRAEVTAASVENIIKVASGQQLAGIAMGDSVLAAMKGEAPFRRPMDVSVLFALYPNVVQFIVPANSSIKSVEDLKGKKVSVGAPGSGTRVGSTAILKALGINEGDFKAQSLNYTATTEALANGQIDAGVIIGSAGVGAITELALTRDVRVLSFSKDELDKIHAALPAYAGMDIPAETYNKVPAFTAPAVWNVLVVKKDLDPKLASEMVKTAFANMDKIKNVIADAKNTTVANMERLEGAPLHPSSLAYYNEMKGK
ncbi:TAXI family TRAP transporter solute-binding subunit [Gallaecimonas pentaromativorans]|uniref:TRAP transporter TAXI family solute receptor n=1 Tax=Gallaecimonas pentaromativorans TaxID=584787 RepID=A0A3N1PSI0_9GAMM|nr:TAXI family TRAP transporter solute-binding subunit [Gallaecimonas pentaromativorans]ROQ27486.1 hypothetical protein EDC28_104136 [Gallaecimonas pentaromativorans]